MLKGDLAIYEPENLLVVILIPEYQTYGPNKMAKVRDAKNKSVAPRIVPMHNLRPATDKERGFVKYLFTDEKTGKENWVEISVEFINAVGLLQVGRLNPTNSKTILSKLRKADTDTTRRQFRAAVAYHIERGIAICSSNSGYFIVTTPHDIDEYEKAKDKRAESDRNRIALLRSIDLSRSLELFKAL